MERFNGSVTALFTWTYPRFVAGEGPRDHQFHFNGTWTLRGGHTLSATAFVETFGFDDRLYRDFAGYGSSLAEEDSFRFRGLSRTGDGFFTKLSYLFRM